MPNKKETSFIPAAVRQRLHILHDYQEPPVVLDSLDPRDAIIFYKESIKKFESFINNIKQMEKGQS